MKLDLESKDLIAEKLAQLEKLFPNLVTEGPNGKVLDLDQLKNEFSTEVVEGTKERYRLEWPGKKEAIVTANLPTTKTLRPVKEDSVDWDNTENLYIEGDNLEVLKILQESYFGKIKMIYIDPPYNTGKDFVYKDNFSKDAQEELEESGQKDEYNQRLFQNADTSGRYHSDWLSMMYPRLKLARNLLSTNGAIFVSLDDNEVHNMKKICDEVFGEGNFIANAIWHKKYAKQNDSKLLSTSHDSVLIYAKNVDEWEPGRLERTEEQLKNYKNLDNDSRGLWQSVVYTCGKNKSERPNLYYPITNPFTGEQVYPSETRVWGCDAKKTATNIEENRLWWGENGELSMPRKKVFLSELKDGLVPDTLWSRELAGDTQAGKREILGLFEKAIFETPKPSKLIQFISRVANLNSEDCVLDFFSGSGSSAHAVMQLNAEDGGNRKHIMVQIPEATDEKSEAFKSGYPNICEIGKERIRRAAAKIENEELRIVNELKAKLEAEADAQKRSELETQIQHSESKIQNLDLGFRVYRLDDSNMADVYHTPQDYDQDKLELFADNVKEGRSADDLLAQIMLDWGLPLSLPIEENEVAGKRVFKVAGNSLMACFDTGIDETFAKEIAKEEPLRIVFKDAGFASDTAKSNVQQLLKQLSPETEMKVI